MKVGIFDHVERADRAMAVTLDERLAFAAAADEAGIYALHVAEHHATRLNLVPVPGVYLGAVARATKRIRVGPLVYLLPLYSPLRLAEEICILDHLSHGRLDIGVGRGVSPFELGYHKVVHDQSRDIFIDAFDCLNAALTNDPFSYAGPHYSYADVPMPLRPLQQPSPPRTPLAPPGRATTACTSSPTDRPPTPRSISPPTRPRWPSAAASHQPSPSLAAELPSACCAGFLLPTAMQRRSGSPGPMSNTI